jgi:hypothetical protein
VGSRSKADAVTREVDEETLQKYFDGELPSDKADLVRLVLEGSEVDRARLARHARTHEFVALAADDLTRDLDSEKLFAAIQGGIKKQAESGFGEGLRVIDGGGGSTGSHASIRPVERWKVGIPVVAVLAVAAALAVAFFPGTGTPAPGNAPVVTKAPVVPPPVPGGMAVGGEAAPGAGSPSKRRPPAPRWSKWISAPTQAPCLP